MTSGIKTPFNLPSIVINTGGTGLQNTWELRLHLSSGPRKSKNLVPFIPNELG